MTPDEILEKLRIYSHREIFQLGCSSRINQNVSAQQQRAFNLIWALQSKKTLGGKSIGIIGGGIGGITVASAAVATGALVTLYDKAADVLHLQS